MNKVNDQMKEEMKQEEWETYKKDNEGKSNQKKGGLLGGLFGKSGDL